MLYMGCVIFIEKVFWFCYVKFCFLLLLLYKIKGNFLKLVGNMLFLVIIKEIVVVIVNMCRVDDNIGKYKDSLKCKVYCGIYVV